MNQSMKIPTFPGYTGGIGRQGDYITIGGGGSAPSPLPQSVPPIVVIPPVLGVSKAAPVQPIVAKKKAKPKQSSLPAPDACPGGQ